MASRDPFEAFRIPDIGEAPGVPPAAPGTTTPRAAGQTASPPPANDPLAFARVDVGNTDPLAAARIEPDVGVNDIGLTDKLASASVAFESGVRPMLEAGLRNIGDIDKLFSPKEDYDAWQSMTPQERQTESLAKGIKRVMKFSYNFTPTAAIAKLITGGEEGLVAKGEEKLEDVLAGQAIKLSSRLQDLEQDKILPGFWTQTLPQGIGSTATVAAAAAASAVATGGAAPAWAVAGWLGANAGADQMIEDAISNGATQAQARIMAGVGTLAGSTEAIPIARVLDRVDTSTGGILSKLIHRELSKKLVGSALKEGLKGAFEEGLQEVSEQVIDDAAAALLYDPDRPITTNAVEAAIAGGGTGFVMSAVAAALGIPLAREQRREQVRREARLITGQPLDESMEAAVRRDMPFTPLLPAYFEIKQGISDTIGRLEELQQNLSSKATLTTKELSDILGKPIGLHYNGAYQEKDSFEKTLDFYGINYRIEKGLPKVNEKGDPLTVVEALKKQPVVVAGFRKWNLEYNDAKIRHQKLVESKAQGRQITDSAIKRSEEKLKDLEGLAKQETSIAKDLKNLMADMRMKYLSPDTKIVLTDELRFNTWGSIYTGDNGRLINIAINLPFINQTPLMSKSLIGAVRETALHEFGHAVAMQRFNDITTRVEAALRPEGDLLQGIRLTKSAGLRSHYERVLSVQTEAKQAGISPASAEDFAIYKGVIAEYKDWLTNQLNSPVIDRFRRISGPIHIAYWEAQEDRQGLQNLNLDYSYFYNFDEFMAENFTRAASQHKFVSDASKTFFTKQRTILENIYSDYADQPTMQGFTDWLRLMSYEGKLQAVVEEQAKQNLTRYDFYKKPELASKYGLNPEEFKGLEANKDMWSRWHAYGLSILQVAARNRHIEPLQRYQQLAYAYNDAIGEFRWRGHNTLRDWRKLGKKQGEIVSKILLDETLEESPLSEQEKAKLGLTQDGQRVINTIKADFAHVLDRIEKVLLSDVQMNFFNDPMMLESETNRVKDEIAKMRAKPFFPLMRFGKYTLRISDKAGKIIRYETFETQKERDSALTKAKADYDNATYTFGTGKLTDAELPIQGMAPPLIRALRDKLKATGDLTPEMEKAIEEQLKDALPIASFRHHFARRKKIAGYSEDAFRAYADYMVGAGTHLARIEYSGDLNNAVNDIARDAKIIEQIGENAEQGGGTKRSQIADYVRNHLTTMMHPENDWPLLRSLTFMHFLGANVKSAFVNSTQLFLATHPYLASRYGDVATTTAMTKAIKGYFQQVKNGKSLTPQQQELLARGKSEQWIDESLATELAIARSSSGLNSSLPVGRGKRVWTKASEIASLPFHVVEKMNRTITALAAHDLALKAGLTQPQAIAMAREAVRATQFEYARWAKPAMFRGKVGANLLMFQSYTQNMLDLMFGGHKDPAQARMFVTLLLTAGVMGLPFAEDAADFFDFAATKLKKLLGWQNPKVQSRVFLREMLQNMNTNPDLFLHGIASNSMGLGTIADELGIPFPNLDLQQSLSMGNILPGDKTLSLLQNHKPEEALFDFIAGLTGAEGGYMSDVAMALLEDNPDTWKRVETALPTALRSMIKAGRYATRGGEMTARGVPIAEFDPFDLEDNMEIAAQAMGFTPSKIRRGWEEYMQENDSITFYETYRRELLKHHNYARLFEDGETIQDALDAIRQYNATVPYPEMKIGGQTLKRSLEEYARQRAEAGLSIPQMRQYNRLSADMRELYNESEP